jgi:hypothetical protein
VGSFQISVQFLPKIFPSFVHSAKSNHNPILPPFSTKCLFILCKISTQSLPISAQLYQVFVQHPLNWCIKSLPNLYPFLTQSLSNQYEILANTYLTCLTYLYQCPMKHPCPFSTNIYIIFGKSLSLTTKFLTHFFKPLSNMHLPMSVQFKLTLFSLLYPRSIIFRICLIPSLCEAFRYQGIMSNFKFSGICIFGGNKVHTRSCYLAVCGSLHTSMTEVTRLCYHCSVTVYSSIFCYFSVFCSFFQSGTLISIIE